MVKVKICGLMRGVDTEKAIELGCSAVGFIFTKNSKRFIKPEMRKWISEIKTDVRKVGVFADQTIEEIQNVYHDLNLNIVQLHGKENSAFIDSLKLPVLKSIIIDDVLKNDIPQSEFIEKYLLDTAVKNQFGGTGVRFDWKLIPEIKLPKPFIIAGGINPENISELLDYPMIDFIDVNSGVEVVPGIKDHQKMELLFAEVNGKK